MPTWSFPAPFIRPSVATALALKCKASDRTSPVIGPSSDPRADVMATGFTSTPPIVPSQFSFKPAASNFSPSTREICRSLDEFVAAVTLASGFLREH